MPLTDKELAGEIPLEISQQVLVQVQGYMTRRSRIPFVMFDMTAGYGALSIVLSKPTNTSLLLVQEGSDKMTTLRQFLRVYGIENKSVVICLHTYSFFL